MDIEKRLAAVENGDRIKALEDEIAQLRAANRQLMREADDARSQAAQAAADLASAHQAHANAAPAAPPVVNVPAPVVNVPAPVVNVPAPQPIEYDVRVARNGMNAIVGLTLTPRKPLNI